MTVESLIGFGIPEAAIARVLGVDEKTMRKYYRDELDLGIVKMNANVAKNLYRMATGNGREAAICAMFWLKTRAGWRTTDAPQLEVLGKKELAEAEAERVSEGRYATPGMPLRLISGG